MSIHSKTLINPKRKQGMSDRYSHLNPAFLGETIGKLDAVYDNLRCQDVANQKRLTNNETATAESEQLPLWCKWLTRRPLKAESTGSSPVSGTFTLKQLT